MSNTTSRGRVLALLATLPLIAAGSTVPALASASAPASAPAERAAAQGATKTTPTAFALTTRGFGSRVSGGEVPVESDTTAFQRIGCTNRAGLTKQISEADVEVPGLGTVSGVRTVLRTGKKGGTVSSTSVQRVASVVLAETPMGTLSIDGLRAEARAFHDADGFHATAATSIGRIVLTPAVGDPQVFDLPSPGEPLEIPGLAEIRVGPRHSNAGAAGAAAQATTLIVDVEASGTRAIIGLARARMQSGVRDVLFRGSSSGIRAEAVDGLLTKKRTPLTLMPCQGTGGKVQDKAIAGLDLTDAIEVGALTSEQWTTQTGQGTRAYERGSAAGIDLGDGALVIDATVAKANLVKPRGGKLRFNAKGTTVGSVTVDGEPQTFPDTGVLEIPGVARLEAKVTKRTKQTFSVVGVRITLLDGSGGVIDLGTAKIGESGLDVDHVIGRRRGIWP